MSDTGRKSSQSSSSPTSKKSHWWSEILHWTHGSESSIHTRSSVSTSSSSSSPEPKSKKQVAAEQWRKERRNRAFLSGW